MDISIQLSMLLWISIWISLDFYRYQCIDLLWILDPGMANGAITYKSDDYYALQWKYESDVIYGLTLVSVPILSEFQKQHVWPFSLNGAPFYLLCAYFFLCTLYRMKFIN